MECDKVLRLPVTTKTPKWSRFAAVNKTNLRQLLNIKKSKIKATNILETTTLTEDILFLSNDANEAGS